MSSAYNIFNEVNYTPVGIGSSDPATHFPAIYGNTDYGFSISFTIPNLISILSASSTLSDISILSSNEVRIERNENITLFPGEFFDFARFEENEDPFKTIETYTLENTSEADEETSLVNWNTPTNKIANCIYNLTFNILNEGIPSTVEISYNQELHWHWSPGLQTLEDLIDRSKW